MLIGPLRHGDTHLHSHISQPLSSTSPLYQPPLPHVNSPTPLPPVNARGVFMGRGVGFGAAAWVMVGFVGFWWVLLDFNGF